MLAIDMFLVFVPALFGSPFFILLYKFMCPLPAGYVVTLALTETFNTKGFVFDLANWRQIQTFIEIKW